MAQPPACALSQAEVAVFPGRLENWSFASTGSTAIRYSLCRGTLSSAVMQIYEKLLH